MRACRRHIQSRPPLREFVGVESRGEQNSTMSLQHTAAHGRAVQRRGPTGSVVDWRCYNCHRHLDRLRRRTTRRVYRRVRLNGGGPELGPTLKHPPAPGHPLSDMVPQRPALKECTHEGARWSRAVSQHSIRLSSNMSHAGGCWAAECRAGVHGVQLHRVTKWRGVAARHDASSLAVYSGPQPA